MCRASAVHAMLDMTQVPLYDGALDCLRMGIESSLQPANVRLRRAVANHDEATDSSNLSCFLQETPASRES